MMEIEVGHCIDCCRKMPKDINKCNPDNPLIIHTPKERCSFCSGIIVKIPDIIKKEDELEYIRNLLPTEEQREVFDYFIEKGLLSFKDEV